MGAGPGKLWVPSVACLLRSALLTFSAALWSRWIEERKRHFPSAANLEKKDAERDKRQQRGELDPVRCGQGG